MQTSSTTIPADKSDISQRHLVVIQCRYNSTRLPGKAMMLLGGIPMLSFLLKRLKAGLPEERFKIILATTEDAAYTIQVFASRKHENAKKLVEKLKVNGFEDAFIFKHTAGSKTLYRVRVGKVVRSETKKLADKLKNLKYIESVQVTSF